MTPARVDQIVNEIGEKIAREVDTQAGLKRAMVLIIKGLSKAAQDL